MKFSKKLRDNLFAGTLIGVVAAIIIGILGCVMITYFIYAEKIGMESSTLLIVGIHALAAFAGTVLSKVIIEKGRRFMCLLTGAGYALVLVLFNLFAESGVFSGVVTSLLGITVGSFAGMFILNTTKRKVKYRAKKVRIR